MPKQGILSFDDRRNMPIVLMNDVHFQKSFASLSHPLPETGFTHLYSSLGVLREERLSFLKFLFIKPITFMNLCPRVMHQVPGIGVVFACQ